ncbi:MAG: hypothetical protein ACREIC_34015, partial [Limisphaerales bacterium]
LRQAACLPHSRRLGLFADSRNATDGVPAAQPVAESRGQANVGSDIYASAAFPTRITDNMFGQRVDFLNRLTGNRSIYYYYQGTQTQNAPAGVSASYPSGCC